MNVTIHRDDVTSKTAASPVPSPRKVCDRWLRYGFAEEDFREARRLKGYLFVLSLTHVATFEAEGCDDTKHSKTQLDPLTSQLSESYHSYLYTPCSKTKR